MAGILFTAYIFTFLYVPYANCETLNYLANPHRLIMNFVIQLEIPSILLNLCSIGLYESIRLI